MPSFWLIIYFLAGVIQDTLLTLNFRYVAKEKIMPAVVFSFLTTVVTMLVLYNILTQLDAQRSVAAILVYSAGIGTGTWVGMKLRLGKKP